MTLFKSTLISIQFHYPYAIKRFTILFVDGRWFVSPAVISSWLLLENSGDRTRTTEVFKITPNPKHIAKQANLLDDEGEEIFRKKYSYSRYSLAFGKSCNIPIFLLSVEEY